jgi:hypothetical protein
MMAKGNGLMRLAGHTPSLLTRLCQGRVGEYKAMCNVLRLRQVGGQLSPNCMLGFILGASALKQLLLAIVCLFLFLNGVRLVISI